SARILWVKLDGLAKFRDRLLRNPGDQVGTAKHHVDGRRLSHFGFKLMEPGGSFRQLLCRQISDAKKIAVFKVVFKVERGLQLLDCIAGFSFGERDSAQQAVRL